MAWLSVCSEVQTCIMAQLMPLSLTVSCFSKIQIGFTFLVPAHLGSPGKRAVKRVCVCVCAISVVSCALCIFLWFVTVIVCQYQLSWCIVVCQYCDKWCMVIVLRFMMLLNILFEQVFVWYVLTRPFCSLVRGHCRMVIWFNLVLKVLFTVTVKVVIFVCPLFHQFHDP